MASRFARSVRPVLAHRISVAKSAASKRRCIVRAFSQLTPLRSVDENRWNIRRGSPPCHPERRFFASKADGKKKDDEPSPGDSSRQAKSDHAHCVDLVRTRDRDGYLCGLLMPPSSRDSYFALRAFNVEVASVKDGGGLASTRSRRVPGQFGEAAADGQGVDVSLASRLRMQWWRDAVAEMYEIDDEGDYGAAAKGPSGAGFLSSTFASTRKNNPVVRELTRAVQSSQLTRRFLERLIDARESDLDVRQPDTLGDLVRYGEEAHSSLLYLALECADVRDDGADEAAYHIGVGLGIVTALRSTVVRAGMGEVTLPAEIMEQHGAHQSYLMNPPKIDMGEELSLGEREADKALRAAVREVAHAAGAHLMHARGMQGAVPGKGRPALLPAVGALSYLKALEGTGFDLLSPDLMAKEGLPARLERLRVTFSLGRAWMTGVF